MGLGEEKLECRERDAREIKVIVSVIETSKGVLGKIWGVDLANGKRGTSAYRVADTGERGKACQEKSSGGNQRQGNVQLQKKGSSIYLWRQ